MIHTRRRRLVLAGLFAVLTVILPQNRWSPPPESLRLGPIRYDNLISSPREIRLGNTRSMNPTDVTIFFRFVVRERPVDFAYLFSTANGLGSGLKVSIDLYGNLYWSAALSERATAEYQLVKISDPTPPGTEHTLEIKIDTNRSWMEIRLDGKKVPIVEARPLKTFDVTAVRPLIDHIQVGGMDSHDLNGTISDLNIVFGRSDPRIDLVNVKILLMLIAVGLVVSTVGRTLAREV